MSGLVYLKSVNLFMFKNVLYIKKSISIKGFLMIRSELGNMTHTHNCHILMVS
jgi:hypothetical protein